MTIDVAQLCVRRDDLGATDVRSLALPSGGGVVVEVERFALTANNVTYAVMGEALRYWDFFPTDAAGWGVVPAWGVGRVVASDHAGIATGERWYGFVPMATHLVVQPGEVTTGEVVDDSPQREGLAGAYQRYARLQDDPLHDPSTLDLELLYRPLFTTAFLLAEVVAGRTADQPHDVVVITSASSKTGTALAHLLDARDVVVVGVTSADHVAHVTATGLHDRVLAYDGLDGLDDLAGRAVVVDLAGRADVVATVHDQLPGGLASHLVVGVTHHDAGGGRQAPAAGAPEPETFFAPTHAADLARQWGPAKMRARLAAAWRPFVAEVAQELTIVELGGLEAAGEAWSRLVDGEVEPAVGLVVALAGAQASGGTA